MLQDVRFVYMWLRVAVLCLRPSECVCDFVFTISALSFFSITFSFFALFVRFVLFVVFAFRCVVVPWQRQFDFFLIPESIRNAEKAWLFACVFRMRCSRVDDRQSFSLFLPSGFSLNMCIYMLPAPSHCLYIEHLLGTYYGPRFIHILFRNWKFIYILGRVLAAYVCVGTFASPGYVRNESVPTMSEGQNTLMRC